MGVGRASARWSGIRAGSRLAATDRPPGFEGPLFARWSGGAFPYLAARLAADPATVRAAVQRFSYDTAGQNRPQYELPPEHRRTGHNARHLDTPGHLPAVLRHATDPDVVPTRLAAHSPCCQAGTHTSATATPADWHASPGLMRQPRRRSLPCRQWECPITINGGCGLAVSPRLAAPPREDRPYGPSPPDVVRRDASRPRPSGAALRLWGPAGHISTR